MVLLCLFIKSHWKILKNKKITPCGKRISLGVVFEISHTDEKIDEHYKYENKNNIRKK